MAFSSSSPDDYSPSSSPQSTKRRHHTISPFYLYCKEFIDECQRSGRLFRTPKHGFEAAALQWSTMTPEEMKLWREKYREERKKCAAEGSRKMKERNGDRGDPNCDTTELGRLKALSLKAKNDISSMTIKWTWRYPEKQGVWKEVFLVVNAKFDSRDATGTFKELALVEFNLKGGITNNFHVHLGHTSIASPTESRYDAIRRVLNWPSKINRKLQDGMPIFFVPPGKMAAVFNALTYVAKGTKASVNGNNWTGLDPDISLSRDLANIDDLVAALREWFGHGKGCMVDDGWKFDDNDDCLGVAQECAQLILAEFAFK